MKMMDRIKHFISRQRVINKAEKKLKKTTEQKLLGQVLKKFNEIRQIRDMRYQHMGRVCENMKFKHLMVAF